MLFQVEEYKRGGRTLKDLTKFVAEQLGEKQAKEDKKKEKY